MSLTTWSCRWIYLARDYQLSAHGYHYNGTMQKAAPPVNWNSVPQIVTDLTDGRPAVICDDRVGRGEGHLIVCAPFADADTINFMASEARGIVALALPWTRCVELGLEKIPRRGDHRGHGESMMVSIEAREGVSTGISAADRARTIAVTVDPSSRPSDLVGPGHVFPLRAHPGGLLKRSGRVEAAVELASMAGTQGAAICQILDGDGYAAGGERLAAFSARHGLAMVTISAVAAHCRA